MPKVGLDAGEGGRTAAQGGFGATGSLPLKPLSSPRASQQHAGGVGLGQADKPLGMGGTASDPNALYQQ